MLEEKGEKSPRESGGPDWTLLEKYAEDERRRVDGIKDELRNGAYYNVGGLTALEREKKVASPGILRKVGRTILDSVNLHPKSSEKRRQREALAVAKQEMVEEDAERDFTREMDVLAHETGRDVRRIVQEEAQEKQEKAELERDMVREMDVYRNYIHERHGLQRRQEALERELNEKLVTVARLEEEVEAGNEGVGKRFMDYDGQEIAVYDLKGLPFAMLSHAIDYRDPALYTSEDDQGVQTAKDVVKNPDVWRKTADEVEMVKLGGEAKGDTISVSYINSEHNLNTRVHEINGRPNICYGFERVEGDAILATGDRDLGSTNNFGGMKGTTDQLLDWKMLEAMPMNADGYNEVVLRRYDETGKPRLPDYIIAQNNKISEGMLRHAARFNIPIVNIGEEVYNAKFQERAEEILDGVSETDDYEKVAKAFHEIGSFSPYRTKMSMLSHLTFNNILDDRVKFLEKGFTSEWDKRLLGLGKLEMEKRIAFLAETLKQETEKIKAATERGEWYGKGEPEGMRFFWVSHNDKSGKNGVNNNEHLAFNMRFLGDEANVETTVYRDDGMGGKVYGMLEPLMDEYDQVRKENVKVSQS